MYILGMLVPVVCSYFSILNDIHLIRAFLSLYRVNDSDHRLEKTKKAIWYFIVANTFYAFAWFVIPCFTNLKYRIFSFWIISIVPYIMEIGVGNNYVPYVYSTLIFMKYIPNLTISPSMYHVF